MFDRIIMPASFGQVVTKFETSKKLPITVKRQVDKKFFDIFYIQQLFSCFIKNKNIEPIEKLRFGKITLSAKRDFELDSRIEAGKTYYGWKVACTKNGCRTLNVLILLGELTEAMLAFQASQKKED